MSSAVWDLQRAVHATLAADTVVLNLLGGARVYDDVPRGAAFPYVSLAAFTARDWATGTEPGTEITFTVHGLAAPATRARTSSPRPCVARCTIRRWC